jgi:hypothetical protein
MKTKSINTKNYVFALVLTLSVICAAAAPASAIMDIAQTLSDGAQRNTIAFDGFGMITGTFEAQTFFPPGKVADYWGFQYLRDNTPDGNGHNTSFLTNCAYNILYTLSTEQFAALKTLATNQVEQINLYGYKRFPLMKAFRRQLEGDIPSGTSSLSLDAVKTVSSDLYKLDGQICFDRAVLYAGIYRTLSTAQKSHLDAMKAGGFDSWTVSTEMEAAVKTLMRGVTQDVSVALMTYASDLFSWYAGSLDADVYFCPERQGTYYGSFYIKDAPAIGHEGYKIDEALTANAGQYFLDQLATTNLDSVVTDLVDKQRDNLYAGTENIVQIRTDISTLLRSLITVSTPTDTFKAQLLAQVLEKSGTYGELDGEIVYSYTMAFARVLPAMTNSQRANLAAMRKKIMSGIYDGAPFDFSVCTTPFLYSAVISNVSVLDPYISNTDYLFSESDDGVFSVSPSTRKVSGGAGTTTFSVSNTVTMPWAAAMVSGGNWLSITSGASGSGSGTITCSYSANTTTSSRSATIRVTAIGATGSPVDVTVTQEPAQTVTITAKAETGGAISPTGAVSVSYGANFAFNVKPDPGYSVFSVMVDGVAITTIPATGGAYTFTNVTAAHTISASFKLKTLTISAKAGAGGTISPTGAVSVSYGASKAFSIRPDPGYSVSSVVVDGVAIATIPATGGIYSFTNVTAPHNISANFKKIPAKR